MIIEQSTFHPDTGWRKISGPASGPLASFVLAFGGRERLEDPAVFAALRARHPGAHLLIASTAGEILGTEIGEDGLAVTAVTLERSRVAAASVPLRFPADSYAAGLELARRLDGPDIAHVFVVSDGALTNGTDLARGLAAGLPPHVPVSGGLAGDGARFQRTLVGLDGPPQPGLAGALAFYGENFRSACGSAGGWAAFGPERVITRADGNRLQELDGLSALGLYKQYLGDQAAGLPGSALRFPLSLRSTDGGPPVVRTILSVDEARDAMIFAGDMPAGARVRFMHASYEDLLDGAEAAAGQIADRPAYPLAVCVSCVGRRIVLGQRTEEEIELVRDTFGPAVTVTGFYSYGELAPGATSRTCQLHNQTMTVTAFGEA